MVRIHQVNPTKFRQYSELLRLLQDAFAYMDDRIDPPSSLKQLDEKKLKAKVQDETVFVALEKTEIVGCVFARPADNYLYLGKLAVKPGLTGRGLSRLLVEQVETLARGLGLSDVEIETRVELLENQQLFEHFGYIRVAENAHAGFDRPTSFCYRKTV